MRFDQPAYVVRSCVGRSFESRQANALLVGIQHPQCAIVCAHQRQRAFQYCGCYFAKVRSGIERVGYLQQRFSGLGLAFLVGVDSGVLVPNGQLRRD